MPQVFGKLPTTTQPWSTIGTVQSTQKDDRTLYLDCGGPKLAIAILAPNLIRVRLAPPGTFQPRRACPLTKDDRDWPAISFDVEETPTTREIKTVQIRHSVHRDTAQ